MAYLQSCPGCGTQLQPVVGDPQSAPWLCGPPRGCSRGYWPAELSATARKLWRSGHRDFGAGPAAVSVADQVAGDVAAAVTRGTSALPEHLPMLPLATLQQLAAMPGLSAAFAALVAAAVKAKGG